MVHRNTHRKKYPSDLTDEQWAILAPLIPPAKQRTRGGRPRTVNMREVLNTFVLSQPEWLPMGDAAPGFAAQKPRL